MLFIRTIQTPRFAIISLLVAGLLICQSNSKSPAKAPPQVVETPPEPPSAPVNSVRRSGAAQATAAPKQRPSIPEEVDDDDDDDDEPSPPPPRKAAKEPPTPPPPQKNHQTPPSRSKAQEQLAEDATIENVDDDHIDELIAKNDKNVVVFLFDANKKCSQCSEALRELEEIDDDLEDVGTIEVVKTDDKDVAKELGVKTLPALVYFRRRNPILYDGEFKDSTEVLKWVRHHDFVAAIDLDDDNFEDLTDSATPDQHALDWFVMFYKSNNLECNALNAVWETVAHKLRGLVKIGRVDVSESDDVAERFRIDGDDECPAFIFFRKGKMYRYKDTAQDIKSFTSFALHRYKEVRGHRVPDPPTLVEELYEDIKEELVDMFKQSKYLLLGSAAAGGLLVVSLIIYLLSKLIRGRSQVQFGEESREKHQHYKEK